MRTRLQFRTCSSRREEAPVAGVNRRRLDVAFPLTLALSLGEREQRAHVSDFSSDYPANPAASFSVGRRRILPLPKGEGRGEGEVDVDGSSGVRPCRKLLVDSDKVSRLTSAATRASAFTLMEIMLVIGILAIVMAMAIPPIYRGMSKEPMRQAVAGVMDACTSARAAAILQGKPTAVVFHPQERTYAAEGGTPGPKPGASLSGQISDSILIEMLDINLMDYREAQVGRVRFFANGTCDEFTLILHSDKGEYRRLELESTTGILSLKDLR